jgi:N-acetylgalactosamine 4-sulfate 6-O-sulfotransferase
MFYSQGLINSWTSSCLSFETCEAEHGWEGCAHRFESYDPKYESVFYHADQLIKTMYATFLEGWLSMFGSEHVLW